MALRPGFPIRKSTDQSLFAAPRGLSQRITSFIASQRQGIHQMPFETLDRPYTKARTGTSSSSPPWPALRPAACVHLKHGDQHPRLAPAAMIPRSYWDVFHLPVKKPCGPACAGHVACIRCILPHRRQFPFHLARIPSWSSHSGGSCSGAPVQGLPFRASHSGLEFREGRATMAPERRPRPRQDRLKWWAILGLNQ